MALVDELKGIYEDQNPNVDEFRRKLEENRDKLNNLHSDTKGTLLHHCAKNDTIYKRKGILTKILLYEFGANPNMHYDGDFAIAWVLRELKGQRGSENYDDTAGKLILAHRYYDIFLSDGTTNSVNLMMEEDSSKYLAHFMFQMQRIRRHAKMRKLSKYRLIMVYSRMLTEIF